jgi:hypothetical protein
LRIGGVRPDEAILAHLRRFFAGHDIQTVAWTVGPIEQRVPGFRVARIGPGPRLGLWSYVSLGCWRATHVDEHGLEFVIAATTDDPRLVELSAMNAYYHAGPPSQRLDLGHTVPIGEPWLEGSSCDHYVVSVPYPYGPALEQCEWKGGHARILWLMPITEAERDFKAANGLEALEARLEAAGVNFWDPARPSTV